jgi:hypothetical protein
MKALGILKSLLGGISFHRNPHPRRRQPSRARADRSTTPAAERLEERCLLAAAISGWYLFNGKAAQVLQLDGAVTFVNENGGASSGFFNTNTQVVASGWGNLVGNVVGLQIQWNNGSVWNYVPDLSMTGTINGTSPILVQQLGINLTLTNEHGGSSAAHFINSTQFVATNWGNLTGTLVGNTIQWSNGSVWTASNLAVGTPVNVSGAWEYSGKDTKILQIGTTLVFVNENGHAANGTVVDSTHVVATGWGNLGGTIDTANRRIVWDNGSVWDRIPVLDHNENWHTAGGQPTAISQMGVTILFTNENGGRAFGVFNPLTGVTATDWSSLTGTIDFTNEWITWNNSSRWINSNYGINDAVFADVNNWPWLA